MEFDSTQGPGGQLEWMLEYRGDSRCLILCHPHSLYGGNMLDGILESASNAVAALDGSTVRFNFRGVGGSEGEFDQGLGEIDDLYAIVEAFAPKFQTISLGGYSFGAHVAADYSARENHTGKLLLIAPLSSSEKPILRADTLLIAGDNDQFVDLKSVQDWFEQLPSATLHVLDDADHFFTGYRRDIEEAVRSFFRV